MTLFSEAALICDGSTRRNACYFMKSFGTVCGIIVIIELLADRVILDTIVNRRLVKRSA